ncbi:MAG TPA: SMP-30/gluconolactonase/LRE family protein [Casimicrobiaceae bacterium]|nr:SMP-30/gluconolactonase/LRE family protein [Casimicrobiaceae bacterium]
MTTSPFRCVLDIKASLGECAIWSVEDQALWWVDINAPSLNRFDPASGHNLAMSMPQSIGSFAFRGKGGFVAALRDGIWFVNEQGALTRKLHDAPYDTATHRFNDGRCDRQGRFYVGSMNENRDANSAALYRLDEDASFTPVFDDIMISNGLAWSPDGRTMYHADTPTRTIRAFDYDVSRGESSNARIFAEFEQEAERPDGCCIDSEGNYWSAFYRGGKVVRISPQGSRLAEYSLPAMCPTMCALGGPDLKTLFVTSARQQRAQEELDALPLSGGIFAMRVDVPGLPEAKFAG